MVLLIISIILTFGGVIGLVVGGIAQYIEVISRFGFYIADLTVMHWSLICVWISAACCVLGVVLLSIIINILDW
jgi:hypothetical protein